METSAATAYTTSAATRTATTRGFGDLSGEDFFALMIEELQSQDPLNPTDNQQLLQQMSTIRQMEQSSTLNETLQTLAAEQRFGATSSLIGHYVSGTVRDGEGNAYEIQGLVIGVVFEEDGDAILELHNGRQLPASKVDQVTLVENLPSEVLEQLQSELGTGSEDETDETDETGETDDAEGGDATARVIKSDHPVAGTNAGDSVRAFATKADIVASLVDSLLAPGLSVGV